jgi:beta-glucosidase
MTGSTVGVVVVGETPYAEGVGDIGNGRTADLSAADRAAVNKVCAAMKCVVLVVSGRPMNIAPIQGEASAIVASWLPGTEGEGVADTLFGRTPFTGRLPDTWAKAIDTATSPIDVGSPNYDPLYPYGWGLRTDSEKARVTKVLNDLATRRDPAAIAATAALTGLINGQGHWNADGSVGTPAAAFALLSQATPAVTGTGANNAADANLLLSVARDLAQNAIVPGGATAMTATASLTSNAEHDLLVGDPTTAIAEMRQAWQTAGGQ